MDRSYSEKNRGSPQDQNSETHEGDSAAKKRRQKNDQNERNYTCGCGKSYLSYPALYTHVKTKHDSKFPEGTEFPNQSTKSRGRPKKEDNGNTNQEDKKDNDIETDKSLQEFLSYLMKLGQQQQQQEQYQSQQRRGQVVNNEVVLNSVYKPNSIYSVVNAFPEYMQEYQTENLIKYLKEFEDEQNTQGTLRFEDEVDPETCLRKTNCNKLMAMFLVLISRNVTPEFFRELCIFITLYRQCLNQIGQRPTNSNSHIDTNNYNNSLGEYCEIYNGEFLPEICNEFITEYFPQYIHSLELDKNFKWLGSSEDKIKHTINFTLHFCNWVYTNKFSNSKLVINVDDAQESFS